MQQKSQTCSIEFHNGQKIEYVCTYLLCELDRYLCSICKQENRHIHDQKFVQYVADPDQFYKKVKSNVFSINLEKKVREKSLDSLETIVEDNSNILNYIRKLIKELRQNNYHCLDLNLDSKLTRSRTYGFGELDLNSLNRLININQHNEQECQKNYLEIYQKLDIYSNLMIKNAQRLKDWRLTSLQEQAANNPMISEKKMEYAKYEIESIGTIRDKYIYSGTISNDLNYIVSGEDRQLNIWNYQTNDLIKSIEFDYVVWSCKFTKDSTFLYVGTFENLCQYDVLNSYKKLYEENLHSNVISNIYCISNTTIVTISWDGTILKTDTQKKQQLLRIKAHNYKINALDYNPHTNMIASGSSDEIKLWNGFDGSLILEHNQSRSQFHQVLFIIEKNQLISLDYKGIIKIWDIEYNKKKLEQSYQFIDKGCNISIVLKQHIIITNQESIRVYKIGGEFLREICHDVNFLISYNTIQHDSMEAVLILGRNILKVCKFDIDPFL